MEWSTIVLMEICTGYGVQARPTVANGLVYVGGANGQVYAVKQQSSNGNIVRTYMTGGAITVIPVVG
jgi:hypothetical protein